MLLMVMAAVAAIQTGPGPVTQSQLVEVRKTFDRELLDYTSARFRDVSGDGYVICGSVNAKNRMGAFIGWREFVSVHRDGSASLRVNTPGEAPHLIFEAFCMEGRRPVSRDLSSDLTYRR